MKKAVAILIVTTFSILLSICGAIPTKCAKTSAASSVLNYKNSLTLHLTPLSAGTLLQKGSTGPDVTELQTNLTNLGYSTHGIDGIFGTNTYNAVISFQQSHGLTADGIAGPNTQNAISAALNNLIILKMGSSGESVIELQTNLTNLGYSTHGIDGIFGSNTYSAVIAFQSSHGCSVDGTVGPQTKSAIANAVNANAASSSYLRRGSTGSAVAALQRNLTSLGYNTYGIDGDFGNNTYNALTAFQKDHGLNADGIAGPLTQNAISAALNAANKGSSSNCLQMGSTGDAVSKLQANLTSLGYNTYGIDGDFGNNTYNAVRAFQNSHGLSVDGIAGPNTLSAIQTALSNTGSNLQKGSTGDAVYQLQSDLTALGYNTCGIDGDFGNNTYNAVVSFQKAHGLCANGVVDAITQNAITQAMKSVKTNPGTSSYQTALTKAMNITMHYEGSGYAAISGNFDGQGLSLGAFQWCMGQDSLQPLLCRMDSEDNALTRQIFGSNYNAFHNMLYSSYSTQMSWAYSINSNSQITQPWRSEFYNLCETAQFQQIQRNATSPIANRASNICSAYGLYTERGFALAFDVATQNGSVNSTASSIIWSRVSSGTDERTKLRVMAQAVAQASNSRWYSDVYSRKMTIANGSGIVHGEYLNLDLRYGLSDNRYR